MNARLIESVQLPTKGRCLSLRPGFQQLRYNSGLLVQGPRLQLLSHTQDQAQPYYIQLQGACRLGIDGVELPGHGSAAHPEGFGSPVGYLRGYARCLSNLCENELVSLQLRPGDDTVLQYDSGVRVEGRVRSLHWHGLKLVLISFSDCTVTGPAEDGGEVILFDPAWGCYDMAVGASIELL